MSVERLQLAHPVVDVEVGELWDIMPGHGNEGQEPGTWRVVAYGTWVDLEKVSDERPA